MIEHCHPPSDILISFCWGVVAASWAWSRWLIKKRKREAGDLTNPPEEKP